LVKDLTAKTQKGKSRRPDRWTQPPTSQVGVISLLTQTVVLAINKSTLCVKILELWRNCGGLDVFDISPG
jgi:hypothetical protein